MTTRRAPPMTTGELPDQQHLHHLQPPFDGGQAITRPEPPSANRLEKLRRAAAYPIPHLEMGQYWRPDAVFGAYGRFITELHPKWLRYMQPNGKAGCASLQHFSAWVARTGAGLAEYHPPKQARMPKCLPTSRQPRGPRAFWEP